MERDFSEFIRSVNDALPEAMPTFPPDPGPIFDGLEEITRSGLPVEQITRKSGSLGSPDPHLFKDARTNLYYTSSSGKGGTLRCSKDLIHWRYVGRILQEDLPPEAAAWTYVNEQFHGTSLWAPEVFVSHGKYRAYYSSSSWGRRQSYIGMAEADAPEGPYQDRGVVIRTTEASPVNAIDPNVIEDAETGEQFLNYGSFWGGIRQIQLDPETGLRAGGEQLDPGRTVWKRHHRADRAIEGACEFYHPGTGYYYLFASYDSTLTDYNIRAARSRCVRGPFVDHRGEWVCHTHTGTAPDAVGLKIVDGYQFEDHPGWISTGHNGVLREGERFFLSFHARRCDQPHCVVQHIHLMLFDRDGWPLVSPCIYTGETLQRIDQAAMPGVYERIVLDQPEKGHLAKRSSRMYLRGDGQCLADNTLGRWRMIGDSELELRLGAQTERYLVLASFDVDTRRPTLALTGRRDDGLCVWGKKKWRRADEFADID